LNPHEIKATLAVSVVTALYFTQSQSNLPTYVLVLLPQDRDKLVLRSGKGNFWQPANGAGLGVYTVAPRPCRTGDLRRTTMNSRVSFDCNVQTL